jgi:hypothetical protein
MEQRRSNIACTTAAVPTTAGQLVTSERGVCGGSLAFHYANLMSHTAFRQSLACVRILYQQAGSGTTAGRWHPWHLKATACITNIIRAVHTDNFKSSMHFHLAHMHYCNHNSVYYSCHNWPNWQSVDVPNTHQQGQLLPCCGN